MNGQGPEGRGQGLVEERYVEERREGWIGKNATCCIVFIFNREPNLGQDIELGALASLGCLIRVDLALLVTQSEGWSQ